MKKFAFLLVYFSLFAFVTSVSAQRFHRSDCQNEIGTVAGFNFYSGDITQSFAQFSESKLAYGLYFRHTFSSDFSVRLQFSTGSLTGDDKNNPQLSFRKFRFSTSMKEISTVAEWHIFGKPSFDEIGLKRFSPYLMAGFGFTRATATAEAYGSVAERRANTKSPFPEANQKQDFVTTPFGFGVRTYISDRLIFGIEANCRPVYSDQLDGVSINGNPEKNDWYYFYGVTIGYLLNDPNPCRMFR